MRNVQWLLSTAVLSGVLMLSAPGAVLADDADSAYDIPAGAGPVTEIDRGPVFVAIEVALTNGGAVKDDLIRRGLFTLPTPDGKGGMIPGEVKVGDIEKLVDSEVYSVSESSGLEMGTGPVSQATTLAATYKRGAMYTRFLEIFDIFNYAGHSARVTIPANITLAPGTAHVVYTNHLLYINNKFIESGVGWVSWAPSPIIYTFDNYVSTWRYITIPSGVSRDIFLFMDIPEGSLEAQMFVYDTYSGWSVNTYQQVTGRGHRADQQEEQASTVGVWTWTPPVMQYANRLNVLSLGYWTNWNDSIYTDWDNNPPVYESHGIEYDQKWINTWASP